MSFIDVEAGVYPTFDLFSHAYSSASKAIAFNPKWMTGKDRYLRAVKSIDSPEIPFGKIYTTRDLGNYRFLFIGTRFGNVVIYETFQEKDEKLEPIYVFHLPIEIQRLQWFHGSIMDLNAMQKVVGNEHQPNIGVLIERMMPWGES